MKEEIKNFLEGEFLLLTISAGFQHNRIYNKKTRPEERKALQKTIKNKLSEYSVFYDGVVGETAHIKNIQRFAKEIIKRHKNILYGKELRIGTAQKLLNLYLKYLWVWGKIPEPPHCPFDNKIISKIKAGNIKFTKFNSIK